MFKHKQAGSSDKPDVTRRDLALAVLGVVGTSALSGCSSQGTGPKLAAITQAALGNDINWVDTVLGAPPGSPRTGDLGTLYAGQVGGTVVIAKGCIAPGDEGGGLFYWSTPPETDDGGTVIVPTSNDPVTPGCWKRIYSGPLDARWFGADKSATSNTTALQNADLAARNLGVPLRIAGGPFAVGDDMTLGSARIHEPGGALQPASGKTITLSGSTQAPPDAVIFDVSSSGAFTYTDADTTVLANWWSGADIGAKWNNMIASCFGLAVQGQSRYTKGPTSFRVVGEHADVTTAFDCTGINSGGISDKISLDFTGSNVTFSAVTSDCCVDFTGANRLVVRALSIEGGTTPPKVGVLLARDKNAINGYGLPGNAANHEFVDCTVHGQFQTAAVYNSGSEVNDWINPALENAAAGRCVVYLAKFNNLGIQSANPLRDPGNLSQSTATGQNFYGARVYGANVTTAAIEIVGFDRVNMPDVFVTSSAAPHLSFDASTLGVTGFYSPQFYPHGIPTGASTLVTPDHCVEITGTQPVEQVRIGWRNVAANTHVLYISGAMQIRSCTFEWTTSDALEAPDATWRDCEILAQGYADPPITLSTSTSFSGRIRAGSESNLVIPSQPTGAASHMRGIVEYTNPNNPSVAVFGGPVLKRRVDAPYIGDKDGVLWVSTGAVSGLKGLDNTSIPNDSQHQSAGDLIYSYDAAGTIKHVRIVDIGSIT